jgi:hypothetical protein
MNYDTSHRPNWPAILLRAAEIVESYDTSVTLRQLFYRLIAAQLLPNTQNSYKSLSRYTAEARRSARSRRLWRSLSLDSSRRLKRSNSIRICSSRSAINQAAPIKTIKRLINFSLFTAPPRPQCGSHPAIVCRVGRVQGAGACHSHGCAALQLGWSLTSGLVA